MQSTATSNDSRQVNPNVLHRRRVTGLLAGKPPVVRGEPTGASREEPIAVDTMFGLMGDG